MELKEKKPLAIAKNKGIEQIEAHMLNIEQADCPVVHHFGKGICIREVTLQKGLIAIGHHHKKDHMNIMLTGKLALINGDKVDVLTAPFLFNSKPGRKIAYVMETCTFQNIFATNETDIEKIEEEFLDKSETWKANEEEEKTLKILEKESDRSDFLRFLLEFGLDPKTVREISENENDQIPMPEGWNNNTSIRDSSIEGKGLFLSYPVLKDKIIVPARIEGLRTPAGRYTNHSQNPNCKFVKLDNGNIFLVSIRDIKGCIGGSVGEELTVDYRQAILLSELQGVELCQQ